MIISDNRRLPAHYAQFNQNPHVCSGWGICIGSIRTKKLGKFMLADRRFVTEAGKLTTEARESGDERNGHGRSREGAKKSRW
jgi:hypothetical protein